MQKRLMPVIALFLLSLPACSAPDLTQDTPVVRFAYQDRVGSIIPIVAVEQVMFEAEGVRVRSAQFNSGPASAEALYTGAVDVAAMGDTAALIMLARRPDMVILASHAAGEHRHRLMVKADSGLQGLEDLKGKTVAVRKGTSTHGGLLLALNRQGIPVADLKLMDLSPPVMTDALAAGSIEAFAASEPTPSVAETSGARQLATFGGLGNEYPILIVAPRAFVAANEAALERFFWALKRAEAFALANPERVIKLLAEQSGLSPQAVQSAMSRHSYALRLDQSILESLEQTADFLREEGILTERLDVGARIDARFLR